MKRQITPALLLLTGLMGIHPALAATPEQLVVAFQHDYKVWNDQSFKNRQPSGNPDAMKVAEQRYSDMLKKYTRPDFHGEAIAYGSESSHDPAKEKITGKKVAANTAIITTTFAGEYYSPVYEYHFIKEGEQWYLTQLFLVDEDGKYPSL